MVSTLIPVAPKPNHALLARLGKAAEALARARDVTDIKKIIDIAEAARVYAKAAKLSESTAQQAAEIKLRAQRKAGECLGKLQKGEGGRNSAQAVRSSSEYRKVIEEAEIDRGSAQRWQQIAAIPANDFEQYLSWCLDTGEEITTSGLLHEFHLSEKATIIEKRGKDAGDTCTVSDLASLKGKPFGTVYADPPWLYGNQGTRAATGNHYDDLTVEEICDLPVARMVPEQAHLHLWTTNAFLFDARSVIEAWGFEYKSCYVWVKPQMGIGNYWRVSHEFMLLGVRGATPFRNHSLMSWGQFERGVHSAKPEAIRKQIESASPGPYLELFGRRVADGWTVWGDQIKRTMFDCDVPGSEDADE